MEPDLDYLDVPKVHMNEGFLPKKERLGSGGVFERLVYRRPFDV